MKSFFESWTWPRPRGRLHVYALANPAVAAMADAYHGVLADGGVTGLARQPDEFLHVTIEQVQRYTEDLTGDQLTTLISTLGKHIAAVPAFDLTVGPALVYTHAITLDAVPDEPWQQLRRAVRDAATEAFGADALRPMDSPGAPHITISYATADIDVESHLHAFYGGRFGRATLPVNEVLLLAVDQDPVAGVYSWPDPIAAFPLGDRRPE